MRTADGSCAEIWERVIAGRSPDILRPGPVPRPDSVEEVAAWAGREDFRRTVFVAAPVFWVILPLSALGLLVWGIVTAPGEGWTGDLFDGEDSGQPWNFWLVWAGVGVWLLIAIGVLLLRLSVWRHLGAENARIFEHGVAHSIHRASVDYDDGEAAGWPTYIVLDHRLDDRQATRIHEAFEQWLKTSGTPPSGSGPISSETLFGSRARGGYFFLHLPVSQTAGETAEHRWLLITEPSGSDDAGGVTATPVPVPKRLRRIRSRLRRKAERRRSA